MTTAAYRHGGVPHLPRVTYSFRMNTCKSVSKQRTLTPFRMNTYEKQGGGGIRHAKQNLPFRKTDPVEVCPAPRASRGLGREALSFTSHESQFFPRVLLRRRSHSARMVFERSINAAP